jgi:cytochrome c oxidase subunit II
LKNLLRHPVFRVVTLGGVLGLAGSYLILLLPWMPPSDSRQASRTDAIIWGITYVSGVIFGVVIIFMLYAIWRFRRRDESDMRDGAPVHGHTGLELFWTAVPTVIVTAFAIWAGIVLHDNESVASGGEKLRTVIAHGQQYSWSFIYKTDGGFTSSDGTLTLPVGTGVQIQTASSDVIHAFYVPEWRIQQDAVPGIAAYTDVTPTKIGTYRVLCAELCGPGHAGMSTTNVAKVVSAADFATWLKQQQATAAKAKQQQASNPGLKVFAANGCGGCHTYAPANATGKVGPPLDNISSDFQRWASSHAGKTMTDFVHESIVNPNAYIAQGFQPNIMPRTLGQSIKPADLDALVKSIASSQPGGTK